MFVYVWWMKLWECFHASEVEAVSQSQVEEWIWGSFIQSHWPCRTLWPISMFSRIFASERVAVPEVLVDLVVHRVELAPELLELLVAELRERARDPVLVGALGLFLGLCR